MKDKRFRVLCDFDGPMVLTFLFPPNLWFRHRILNPPQELCSIFMEPIRRPPQNCIGCGYDITWGMGSFTSQKTHTHTHTHIIFHVNILTISVLRDWQVDSHHILSYRTLSWGVWVLLLCSGSQDPIGGRSYVYPIHPSFNKGLIEGTKGEVTHIIQILYTYQRQRIVLPSPPSWQQ